MILLSTFFILVDRTPVELLHIRPRLTFACS